MISLSIPAFEKRLPRLIEAGLFENAEQWIAAAIDAACEPRLVEALEAPLDAMSIERWDAIGNAMKIGNWRLPRSDDGWRLARVHIGLLNHSGLDRPLAEVALGFIPPSRLSEPFATTSVVAEGEHTIDYAVPKLTISGLDLAWQEQTRPAIENETPEQREERWRRQSLAAAIILLRFHQLVASYSVSPGFPRQVTIVAHVAHVTWPMEVGIHEYGIAARRLIQPPLPSAKEVFS